MRLIPKRILARVEEIVSQKVWDSLYIQQLDKDRDTTEKTPKRDRLTNLIKLRKMYKGEASYGNEFVGIITDFNASFQWANGIQLREKEEGKYEQELAILTDFVAFNKLSGAFGLDLGREGELSGQALFRWDWDEQERQVAIWTVPLIETKYKVALNGRHPIQAVLYPKSDKEKVLKPEEFVWVGFRKISNGTYGIPTCMRVIDEIEDLDKARQDFRKINFLFASPTPIFLASNLQSVSAIETKIAAQNWLIGKAFVLTEKEDYKLVGFDGRGTEMLLKEIVNLLQIISGATSVPPHFLGYPELLANRSTSDDMFEVPTKRAEDAQTLWAEALETLFGRVLTVYSEKLNKTLAPDAIKVSFPPIRTGKIVELLQGWLPVRLAGEISQPTFHRKINVDPAEETELLKEEAKKTNKVRSQSDEARIEDQIGGIGG